MYMTVLFTVQNNDIEQDLRSYEGKQLRMYQEIPFFAFFICVFEVIEHTRDDPK